MFRFRYRLAVGVVAGVTFILGLVLTSKIDPPVEQPPCRACAQLYASAVPVDSICELQNNRAQYEGKVVILRAYFIHDAGQVNLAGNCGIIHAGLSNSCQSCDGARRALTVYSGFGSWYDGTARVVVLGRIGPLENPTLFPDNNGFNIDCVESAESSGSGRGDRIRYWLGRIIQ